MAAVSVATSSNNTSTGAARACALTRDPAKVGFPTGIEVLKGDLLDIDALRDAFFGVRALSRVNAVTGDEFTQAIVRHDPGGE